ncbi:MAG: adenylosuccinate synthetase [Patescibacteria group bacterium]
MKNRKKLFTVTDLGGGDGGKGGVVHKLCDVLKPHTVIKVGGAQGSHGVRTARGESYNFSQFGCGTFNGVRTFLSQNMVIDPNGILNEGTALKYECGIGNVFDSLAIDEEALCITPYHGIASRLRELARKGNPKGTIGIGVGEAYLDSEVTPQLAIRARDLADPKLRDTLEAVRLNKLTELEEVIDERFWDSDQEAANRQINLLRDPGLIDWTLNRFSEMRQRVRVVGRDYLSDLLAQDGAIVVESSHGILTDRYHGFHPHTTKLRTLPSRTHDMLRDAGYAGEVYNLGVTRGYQIRHGAGPMVTSSPDMVESLLPGSSKDENRFQGKVRVGPLDFVALRYAIEVCGGPSAFDGIAVTWFDQIQKLGSWEVCDRYQGATEPEFFTPTGAIRVRRGDDSTQLAYQERLGHQLNRCQPIVTVRTIPEEQSGIIRLCSEVFVEKLGVSLRMLSLGPTEKDKVCL